LFFVGIYVILIAKLEHTTKEIFSAIYIIEGKHKARQPFGIETIECKTYENGVINGKIKKISM
jgi:hypothetical protein